MSLKSLTLTLALMLTAQVKAETTIYETVTNTINVACFQDQMSSLFPSNSQSLTTGIPVVIVYADVAPANDAAQSLETDLATDLSVATTTATQTLVLTSSLTYTVTTPAYTTYTATECFNGQCESFITTSLSPNFYVTSTEVVYTTYQTVGAEDAATTVLSTIDNVDPEETATVTTTDTTSSAVDTATATVDDTGAEGTTDVTSELSTVTGVKGGADPDTTSTAKFVTTDIETDQSLDAEAQTAIESETETIVAKAIIKTTAVTTTKTVFSATSTPTSTSTFTKIDVITATISDPLLTGSVVFKSLETSIDISSITKAITISTTTDAVPSPYNSNSSSSEGASFSQDAAYSDFGGSSSDLYHSSILSDVIYGLSSSKSGSDQISSTSLYATLPSSSTVAHPKGNSAVQYSSVSPGDGFGYFPYGNSSSAAASSTLAAKRFTSSVPVSASSGAHSFSTLDLSSALSSLANSSSATSSSTVVLSSIISSASLGASSSSSSGSSSGSSSSSESTSSVVSDATSDLYSGDLFKVISTDAPPSVFAREELPLKIPAGVDNNGTPYETNKFYVNLFLDDQTDMVWTYPYGMWWLTTDYYGFAVQHTTAAQRVFTYDESNPSTANYFGNPTNIGSLVFSATNFTSDNLVMDLTDMRAMSALVTLSADGNTESFIDISLVQGMGFVTGIYNGELTALINSVVGINTLTQETSSALADNIIKYRATLFNDVSWLIYAVLPDSDTDFELSSSDSYNIKGSAPVDGLIIQFAVAPSNSSSEAYYDEAAGMYSTTADVQGSVSDGTSASYKFSYTTKGESCSNNTIIFALPHHLDSLTSETTDCSTGITLDSTTKGVMSAYLTTELVFEETLNTDIQFLPWVNGMTSQLSYNASQLQLLAQTANSELAVDIASTVNDADSNYGSGKLIDKYAYILLVVSEIIGSESVTNSTLAAMKSAFEVFTSNTQYYPFMYDTKFGGVTSTASQNGDTGADYGSGYYNDHHFHYGYFVHAAAIVGHIDSQQGGTWAEDNKDWVMSLIRDVANPSEEDNYFPVSRMFDWYAGHSWASGLFSSGDGRNEESTSEDYNFAYGMKMWGKVVGDQSMESRGDLMLAVMQKSLNSYFYYSDDNTIQPAQFIPNKVSGILFDNKIDFTTYFGSPFNTSTSVGHPEYVHGIHMLPISPASSLLRGATFVEEEWDETISTFIDDVDSGWTGILRLNQALYDASIAYDFFSSDSFTDTYLDNGQSRTWSLAFSGGISNAI